MSPPLTLLEVDAFRRFALAMAASADPPASLEERLRRRRGWTKFNDPSAEASITFGPYPDGISLLDVLKEGGLVGLDDEGQDDRARIDDSGEA